jgi:hypothetical protein
MAACLRAGVGLEVMTNAAAARTFNVLAGECARRVVAGFVYEHWRLAPVVASSFRTTAFNRCEGGSARSRHLANNALDFDLGADAGQRLCDWWRRHGKTRGVGLGFYTPRRIHIDTAGFRTWGSDHTGKTSRCVAGR